MSFSNTIPLITENRAIMNLGVIASLEPGKKITCNKETGVIIIDDREVLVSFRRSIDGSYDSDVVQETFRKVLEIIKGIGLKNSMEEHQVNEEWDEGKLVALFEKALKGLVTLDETYKNEGKDRKILEFEKEFHMGLLDSKKQKKQEKCEAPDEVEEKNEVCSASVNEGNSESYVDEEKKEMPFIPLPIPEGDPQDEEGVILAEPKEQERVIGPEDFEDYENFEGFEGIEGFEGPDIIENLEDAVYDTISFLFSWIPGAGAEYAEPTEND